VKHFSSYFKKHFSLSLDDSPNFSKKNQNNQIFMSKGSSYLYYHFYVSLNVILKQNGTLDCFLNKEKVAFYAKTKSKCVNLKKKMDAKFASANFSS